MVENSELEIDQDQKPPFQEVEAPEEVEVKVPEGELHLRFFVGSGIEFALPAVGIKEVLEYSPDRINPMPNVSSMLLGTINLRGRVVWVGDLGQLLGESTPLSIDRNDVSIIAVEDQGLILGLAIEKIGVIAWLDPDELKATKTLPDSMAPFIKGEWIIDNGNHSLKLLDQVSILRSARWAS
ncbi:chemotaxis signal transduction protein [Synechococcus sp. PCC 7502]|uniref:chemotaxis protein CheW n=1 Tax=Synechococcus sp. PCC 7502 TaxID=1173263 RepID=UPI00029FDFD6|nr:chemotaxis protein CheW [Synechococcus sp. PCC 7502]AFY73869.1 chemotaxis signal transduction protein [Synechococcus sp. PCC 7502]